MSPKELSQNSGLPSWASKAECEEAARRVAPALRHPHFVHVLKHGKKWKLELIDKRWPFWNDLHAHCRKLGINYDSTVEKIRESMPVARFPEAVQEFIDQTSREVRAVMSRNPRYILVDLIRQETRNSQDSAQALESVQEEGPTKRCPDIGL